MGAKTEEDKGGRWHQGTWEVLSVAVHIVHVLWVHHSIVPHPREAIHVSIAGLAGCLDGVPEAGEHRGGLVTRGGTTGRGHEHNAWAAVVPT